jgi:hypothetical protein
MLIIDLVARKESFKKYFVLLDCEWNYGQV